MSCFIILLEPGGSVHGERANFGGLVLGGYRFNVYFDRKEMCEKRKYKKENAEAENQFEK